jgi:autophagy-related protein 18
LWDTASERAVSPVVDIDEEILAIKASRKRIVVLSRRHVLIFSLSGLELLQELERCLEIPDVSVPLLAMDDEGFCAFVASENQVRVVDTVTLIKFPLIRCHTSAVSALELRNMLLVTGSTKGTIVRVFSLPSTSLIAQFRRGRSETPIRSLHVSEEPGSTNQILVASGDSDTVHVFRIPSGSESSSSGASVMGLMPKQCKDAIEATRDFASIRLRRESQFNYIAFLTDRRRIMVVSEETGFAFIYELNLTKGGECRLVTEFDLLSNLSLRKGRYPAEPPPHELVTVTQAPPSVVEPATNAPSVVQPVEASSESNRSDSVDVVPVDVEEFSRPVTRKKKNKQHEEPSEGG